MQRTSLRNTCCVVFAFHFIRFRCFVYCRMEKIYKFFIKRKKNEIVQISSINTTRIIKGLIFFFFAFWLISYLFWSDLFIIQSIHSNDFIHWWISSSLWYCAVLRRQKQKWTSNNLYQMRQPIDIGSVRCWADCIGSISSLVDLFQAKIDYDRFDWELKNFLSAISSKKKKKYIEKKGLPTERRNYFHLCISYFTSLFFLRNIIRGND